MPVNLQRMIDSIKKHRDYAKVGMILVHNGVVRATSRDGRRVRGLKVRLNHDRLETLLAAARAKPGIVDVRVQIEQNRFLAVGKDVMILAVAGDIRENVLAVLQETLNAIKTTVTHKTEYYEL